MTDDRSLERAARSWLEEGPTQAPERAVDAALSRIQTTRQERDLRIPWRNPFMNRVVLPMAAALIVVIGAVYLISRPTQNAGPHASPTPAATLAAPSIQGTWDVSFTAQDMLDAGIIGHIASDPDDSGHFRLTFTADKWQLSHLTPVMYVSEPETYSADPGVVHFFQPGDTAYNTPYTLTGTTLTFGAAAPTWLMVKPWTRVSTEPIASPIARPPELQTADVGLSLASGTYRVRGFAVEFAVTLPPGWTVSGLAKNSVTIERIASSNSNVALFTINGVYPDPCHPASDPQVIGNGVDALVAALSAVKGFALTDVSNVTVGGARGKAFRFGNAINTAAAGCAINPMPFGKTAKDGDGADVDVPMFGGETDRFWALDSGGTTIVIAITDTPAIVADTQPVLDSLIFADGSAR